MVDSNLMLQVSSRVSIPLEEIELKAIRSQGPGGQNVNKVSTAVHLFFDIQASSLPEVYKQKLLNKKDRRISPGGVVIIKSQSARTQEANREKALIRLKELIKETMKYASFVGLPHQPAVPGRKDSRKKEADQKRRTCGSVQVLMIKNFEIIKFSIFK